MARQRKWRTYVEGAEELVEMFGDMAEEAISIIDKASSAAADFVWDEAKRNLIKNGSYKTGNLYAAMNIKKEKVSRNTKATYRVGPQYAKLNRWGVNYGHLVELGHKTKSGKQVPAKPFLRPALDENKQKIKDIVSKNISDALDKVVK